MPPPRPRPKKSVFFATLPSFHDTHMINAENVAAVEVRGRHRSALLLLLLLSYGVVVAAAVGYAGDAPLGTPSDASVR